MSASTSGHWRWLGLALCLLSGCAGMSSRSEQAPAPTVSVIETDAAAEAPRSAYANMPASLRPRQITPVPQGAVVPSASAVVPAQAMPPNPQPPPPALATGASATDSAAMAPIPTDVTAIEPLTLSAALKPLATGLPKPTVQTLPKPVRLPKPAALTSTATQKVTTAPSKATKPAPKATSAEPLPLMPFAVRPQRDLPLTGGKTAPVKSEPTASAGPKSGQPSVPEPKAATKPSTAATEKAGTMDWSEPSVAEKMLSDAPPVLAAPDLPAKSPVNLADNVDVQLAKANHQAGSTPGVDEAPDLLEQGQAPPPPALNKPASVTALKPTDLPFEMASADSPGLAAKPTPEPDNGAFTVDHVAFCLQVFGYGNIERMASRSCLPGQQLLLYLEVKNFTSQRIGEHYETTLNSSITIETIDGRVVAPYEFEPIVDRCETKRSDFFCHYKFTLPHGLTPGDYLIRLKVNDARSGLSSERTLPLVIAPGVGSG